MTTFFPGVAGKQALLATGVAVAAALLHCPARAADQPETVVVTAKPPEPVGHAAFSVVQLDESQLTSDRLDSALKQVAGLTLFRRSNSLSANPTIQGVSLRDIAPSGAGRALVLLDGIPMNDPFGNWVIWGALPREDIQSAQIVRGAGSGPYGSGALTGTISLDERSDVDGVSEADASAGTLGTFRAGASGGAQIEGVNLFASATGERSDGWIPVGDQQRGPADDHAWLDSGSASLRGQTQIGDVFASARLSYYNQAQGAGLVGAEAKTRGTIGSLTLADATGSEALGWRVQGWFYHSNLSNFSVSVASDRSSTTPTNDQYETPALGLGMNAALVGTAGNFHWEAGTDLRHDTGQSHEFYQNTGSGFLSGRKSGGQFLVTGLYGEGAFDWGDWLLTGGVRGDYWTTAQGHLLQYTLATGAITTDTHYDGRDGIVPTGRVGLRHDFTDGEFLRSAAYAGFRAPSLNELYRPFRVGNNTTEANPDLSPEKLYGAEVGWGGRAGPLRWDVTGFFNQLHNAIANVSLGGTLFQRQNAGDVNALGVEGNASAALTDALSLDGSFSVTDARFQDNAHNLAGKRPAQSPRVITNAGATWSPWTEWSFGADVRWVGAEFEDDLNNLRLGSALVGDLRAQWRFCDNMAIVGEIDNVTDATVNTGETSFLANGSPVISLGAPRTFEITLEYAQ